MCTQSPTLDMNANVYEFINMDNIQEVMRPFQGKALKTKPRRVRPKVNNIVPM